MFEKIYDEYHDTDDEGQILDDFEDKLKNELIKKTNSEEELLVILKSGTDHNYICSDAEKFKAFKDIIKKYFTSELYLQFLLKLNNPDLEEINENVDDSNRNLIYHLPVYNLDLAIRLGYFLKDKKLLLISAVKSKDCALLLENFEVLDKMDKVYVDVSKIVELLKKQNSLDETKAEILLQSKYNHYYGEKHVAELVNVINDYDYLRSQLQFKQHFPKSMIILEKLILLDKPRTKNVFSGEMVKQQHRTDIVLVLGLIKKEYGIGFLADFIKKNKEYFITSSALKSTLKNEGIFISTTKGEFLVEMD